MESNNYTNVTQLKTGWCFISKGEKRDKSYAIWPLQVISTLITRDKLAPYRTIGFQKKQSHLSLNLDFLNTVSILRVAKKKVVGLERGPLSLVSTIEELLDRKVAAPV
jgi:hypothetical protein